MAISMQCPQCTQQLRTRDEMAGRRMKCPECGTVVPVPASSPDIVKADAKVDRGSADTSPKRSESLQRVPAAAITPANAFAESPFASDIIPADMPRASLVLRALGYLIDLLPTFLLIPFILIPILGQIMMGMLLCIYWLLRDIQGASLGKLALGCRVESVSSEVANPQKGRVIRNLPFAFVCLCFAFPILGFVLLLVVGPVVILSESLALILTGRRLGDMIAGTTVVTNPSISSGVRP